MKNDFQSLYKELNVWKSTQTQKAKEDKKLTVGEKHKIFRSILNTEIEMLQTLDKQYLDSNKLIKKERTDGFLETLGLPKRWKNSYGKENLVTTPSTIRAAELFAVYKRLQDHSLSVVSSKGRQIGLVAECKSHSEREIN